MTRWILRGFAFGLLVIACSPKPAIDLEEVDVAGLQKAMEQGQLDARDAVEYYLQRIAAIDRDGPQLNAIIEINPDALATADALDRERAEAGPRGPLHGIPVVLKANIDTADRMATTAGSLALAGHVPPDDAVLVTRLREAGVIILGKGNLSEWANFRSTKSSSGWSSIGGQTKNPYDPLRNPCGSSSGSAVAVAANLSMLAVGTETDGSIICPAGVNGIVGIKPSLGLVSGDGIIPIAHTQDTAGPMARTVRDAALLLNAMAAKDPADPATSERPAERPDYVSELDADALAGKRIGVLKVFDGEDQFVQTEEVFNKAVELLQSQGAEIVGPVEIDTEGLDQSEFDVLLYEFKAGLNQYLDASGAPQSNLEELIAFNKANADTVMPVFGQDIFVQSQAKGPLTDPEYTAALEKIKRVYQDGIDNVLSENRLDALIAPSNSPAWFTDHVNGDPPILATSSYAAISGYASITVPAGFVAGLPVGLSFIGGPFSEKSLIGMAYAFEQASKVRSPPDL